MYHPSLPIESQNVKAKQNLIILPLISYISRRTFDAHPFYTSDKSNKTQDTLRNCPVLFFLSTYLVISFSDPQKLYKLHCSDVSTNGKIEFCAKYMFLFQYWLLCLIFINIGKYPTYIRLWSIYLLNCIWLFITPICSSVSILWVPSAYVHFITCWFLLVSFSLFPLSRKIPPSKCFRYYLHMDFDAPESVTSLCSEVKMSFTPRVRL